MLVAEICSERDSDIDLSIYTPPYLSLSINMVLCNRIGGRVQGFFRVGSFFFIGRVLGGVHL